MSNHKKKKYASYIWALIELPNNKKEWYCLSKVLRHALYWEKNKNHNKYWKNTLIGSYLNVATTEYKHNQARITVGKVEKIRIYSHRPKDWHWSRNQFINEEALLHTKTAYNYMKHNYSWYNKISIWTAIHYWSTLAQQKQLTLKKNKLKKLRHKLEYNKKAL